MARMASILGLQAFYRDSPAALVVDGKIVAAALMKEFKRQTGSSVIVNTSFNIRGEPMLCTPEDAYWCFLACDMDVLVLESCVLYRTYQTPLTETERQDYVESFRFN